jgi:hypothetical protein
MPDFSQSALDGATLPTNLFNLSTGRAQRSGASTGAKRSALGSPQFTGLSLCIKTVSILKALKTPIKNHREIPEEPSMLLLNNWALRLSNTLMETRHP